MVATGPPKVRGHRGVRQSPGSPAGPSSEGVSAVVWHACDRAGMPRMGAHRLRHTAATHLLQAGGTLAEVGQVLRHRSSGEVTSIYAKVDRRSLAALVRPWPGASR
jgi:integrase/recombinase XerD